MLWNIKTLHCINEYVFEFFHQNCTKNEMLIITLYNNIDRKAIIFVNRLLLSNYISYFIIAYNVFYIYFSRL